MTSPFRERPNSLPWPPMLYLGAMVLAWFLERFDAFEALNDVLEMVPRWVGLGPFVVGAGLDVWAISTLRANKTTVLPNAGAKALVTSGPFRFSRNPIYLGNTLVLLAFAITLRWGWLLLLIPVIMAAVNWLAIAREEEHLEAKFGDLWRIYVATVRRWI